MLKKLILLLFIVAPVSIFAQDKIAYVNSQELFMKMPEMKTVETQLATESETIRKNSDAIRAEYNALLEKFKADTTQISESLLLDRQNQLEGLQKRFNDYAETSSAEFDKKRQGLLAPLQEKLLKAIKEVGDENNYTYILETGALMYIGTNAVDANKAVKAKLGITD
ncbi:MAG: OmpH family outer membrane protein [Dysgonomonas sp.]